MAGSEDTHRLHQSLAQFKQLLASEPQNTLLLERVAQVYARLGRPADAADHLTDRAEILFEQGDLEGAVADCRRALAHEPGHARARRLVEGLTARGAGLQAEDETVITEPPVPVLGGPEEGLYELRVVPASIPPEGQEALRRTPIVDAESLLATHDAEDLALGVDPPTLPPEFLELTDEPEEDGDEVAMLLGAQPTPRTRSRNLERAITSKLPRVAPRSATPRAVSAVEAGPVSADLVLFRALPATVERGLFAKAERRSYGEDQKIAEQGAPAPGVAVITKGRARVERLSERGREQLGHVGEDDVVGLVEHLRGARWRVTVLAETDVHVRWLDASALARLRVAYPALDRALAAEAEHQELLLHLATGPLFGALTPGQREALARDFRARTLMVDEAIAQEGQVMDGLYLVRDGRLAQYRDGERLAALSPGDAAGVLAALDGGHSPVSVVAEEGAEVFFLERPALAAAFDLPGVREAFERVGTLRRLVT
ncbi:MAG: cyclic nucleotide-binding domain-containing protein [Myxococcales bacterium]|nr:cyclic nucleotide-binding domain-containing protein [Myxococcales bacterium]